MPKSIWELEEEIRRQLLGGVDFGGRKVGASVGIDWFTWVKLEEGNPGRLLAVYIKGTVRLTVYATVHDDKVEIVSISLDSMCGGRGTYA